MDVRQQIQKLRLHLLDMSRVSLRTIDYSTKGGKLGYSELCLYFRNARRELDDCHHEITRLSQQLQAMEQISVSDRIFALSAERIANCLRAACFRARDVFRDTMLLRRNPRFVEGKRFLRMSDTVNGLMRLCVVALFKKEISHAKTVLCSSSFVGYEAAEHSLKSQTGMELSIVNDLREIAAQTHQMADAIVFWLENTDSRVESNVRKDRRAFREPLSAVYSVRLFERPLLT
jgi:hypothetical protein